METFVKVIILLLTIGIIFAFKGQSTQQQELETIMIKPVSTKCQRYRNLGFGYTAEVSNNWYTIYELSDEECRDLAVTTINRSIYIDVDTTPRFIDKINGRDRNESSDKRAYNLRFAD